MRLKKRQYLPIQSSIINMEANVNVSFHTNATQLTFDCVISHILAFKYYLCLKKINILDSPLH